MKRRIHLEVVSDVTEAFASHWYRMIGANGKVMMTSEMYANRSNAVRAASNLGALLGLDVIR